MKDHDLLAQFRNGPCSVCICFTKDHDQFAFARKDDVLFAHASGTVCNSISSEMQEATIVVLN